MGLKLKKIRGERVIAVIQARMFSQNLQGKALIEIEGATILEHIIQRIKRVKPICETVVSTSTDEGDEAIIREAERLGIPTIIGDSRDVLSRFRTAARIMQAGTIVIIKGDSPLISPEMMTRVINYRRKHQCDYVAMEGLPEGTGVEVLTMRTLVALDRLTTLHRHREDVTLYLRENSEEFDIKYMNAPVNVKRPHYKLSVDTVDELELIRYLFQNLTERKHIFSLQHIVKYIDKHPEFMEISPGMEQVAA